MSQPAVRGIEEALLWGLPADIIRNALDAADGGEIASGKIFSERSSSALALNVFGPFFEAARASRLPPLPGSDAAGWPARSVRPEAKLREPFDMQSPREWQQAYLDHDWGGGPSSGP